MEDLEIEVPPHFQCPISLQLMRDPVTLSTGITYDRHSIEKWISSSSVCPVTKQPISSDLIPNHTLRRLIQAWCTLNEGLIDRIPTPKPVIDRVSVTKLISAASRSSLQRIKSIALRGTDRDRAVLVSAGAFAFLAKIDGLEVEILAKFDASEEDLRSVMNGAGSDDLIERLTRFLSEGDSQTRNHSIKLMKSLYSAADHNKLVNVRSRVFRETVKLISDQISTQSTNLALKLLISLNRIPKNRIKSVESRAVTVLIDLLLETHEKRICELAMVALDNLCSTAEGRAELVSHAAGVAVVSKKILRVSHTVSDRGVRILGSVARYSSGNGVVLGEMAEVGVVAKLCLVLQVDCSLKTKERAKEILKLNARVWRKSECVPKHLLRSYPTSF